MEKREDSVDSLIFKNTFKGASRLDIVFNNSLESIALVSEKGASVIDFNKYKYVFADHNRGLFEALTRSKEGVFKNLEINKNDQIIELVERMTEDKIFKRKLVPCKTDGRIMIDSGIDNFEYVNSFGFEWTKIDGLCRERIYVPWPHFWQIFITKTVFL